MSLLSGARKCRRFSSCGHGRPCDHAATVCFATLMCLRFSSSPEFADTPVRSETGQLVLVAMKGLFEVLPHFLRSSGFSRS